MRKRFDFVALLMALAAVTAALIGAWVLSRPVKVKAEAAPVRVAEVHIELPAPASEPTLGVTPDPTPAFNPKIPLPESVQTALFESCEERGVPVALALGLIEVESGFDPSADNGLCYGLMQLNRQYFPGGLSQEDNAREGIACLGRLLKQYGDTAAALTAYNAGHDTGARGYARAVMAAAERREVKLDEQ